VALYSFNRRALKRPATQVSFSTPKLALLDYSMTVTQARIDASAKFEYVLRGTWAASMLQSGGTFYTFFQAVRAKNPAVKLGIYVILTEMNVTTASATLTAQFSDALNAANGKGGTDGKGWWAYGAGTTNKTNYDTQYAGWYEVNPSDAVMPDSNGNRWPEVCAIGMYQGLLQWLATAVDTNGVPLLNWVMNDNVWYAPRADKAIPLSNASGDYNLDGVNEACDSAGRVSNTTVRALFRAGYKKFWDKLRTLAPGLTISGNTDCDQAVWKAASDTTELTGQLDHPLLEAFVGRDWSIDTWGGFTNNMKWYRSAIASKRSGGTVFVMCYLDQAVSAQAKYRLARYGLGCTMLDGGHMMPSDTDSNGPYWCAEFDAQIGAPIEAAPTTAWSNGVFRRRYENGCILVNPVDNKGRWINVGGLTLSRTSSGLCTLSYSGLSGHGQVAGNLIRLEKVNNGTFNGTFQITAVTATSISWQSSNTTAATITGNVVGVTGFFGLQTTVDLSGQGYKRILSTSDSGLNYDGTLNDGAQPVYTSQNDGSLVTTVKLWPQDALLLLKA
jgi:hypothetical protein